MRVKPLSMHLAAYAVQAEGLRHIKFNIHALTSTTSDRDTPLRAELVANW
jgi:hypothetical protein